MGRKPRCCDVNPSCDVNLGLPAALTGQAAFWGTPSLLHPSPAGLRVHVALDTAKGKGRNQMQRVVHTRGFSK